MRTQKINLSIFQSQTYIYCLCAILFWLPFFNPVFAENPLHAHLHSRIDQLHDTHTLVIGDSKIVNDKIIHEFYSRRNFMPAWNERSQIEAFLTIIRTISNEGLQPEDYSLSDLEILYAIPDKTIEQQADFDILLSDSLLRLGFQVRFGKVNPITLDPNWNFKRDIEGKDPATIMQDAIDSASLQDFFDTALHRQSFYQRFKAALVKYNRIKEQGGWPVIPEGPTLKIGMDNLRIILLRIRLLATDDLHNNPSDAGTIFDENLEQAVIRFQQRHGLEADGKVGRQTIKTMNVSVDDRINQIRVNLERGRWLLKDLQGDYLVVNIAGFQAFLFRNGKKIWHTNVMVGKTFRQTPVFKSQMEYLVFNPTWTIPPGILRADILPKVRKDSEYIRKKGYHVLDRQGKQVDYDTIDWENISIKNFPYIIRQPAGPDNALGQVKFIFPNSHFVFLHDTNYRNLFSQPERAFSSGCIRVENPLALAELILNDSGQWNHENIVNAIETGKTRTVHLKKPLPVLLLYWTFMVDENGTMHFMKDIYQRDKKILDALQAAYVPTVPENLPAIYQ